jgi:hypothetical protein
LPVKTGSQIFVRRIPTPEGVGYGSYAGFADGLLGNAELLF